MCLNVQFLQPKMCSNHSMLNHWPAWWQHYIHLELYCSIHYRLSPEAVLSPAKPGNICWTDGCTSLSHDPTYPELNQCMITYPKSIIIF